MSADDSKATRRSFLGAATGLAAAAGLGGAAGVGITTASQAGEIPAGTLDPLDPKRAGLPYRQDDPRWGADLMWNRASVLNVARREEGFSATEAEALMREFPDGNNIANEGCQLTCLAMVLRLLNPGRKPAWTPGNLNTAAHDGLYYTLSGLSVSTLYSDMGSDLTDGSVQLVAKEEYPIGQPGWPRVTTETSPLACAYLSLDQSQRASTLLMLKTGTWDDTVASHYVLIDPTSPSNPEQANPPILDPAMPEGRGGAWTLSDSAKWIRQDREIDQAWSKQGIGPLNIGGAWAFSRFDAGAGSNLAAPLIAAWSKQLADHT